MSSRRTSLFLSAVGWAGFVVVVLWTIVFLAGVVVPRTVDGPARTTTGRAVVADLALLGLFAVQHSAMARREVKSWLHRRIPAPLERTTYVLATNACLALLLVLWQPWGGQVWDVNGAAAVVLWSLCAAGWLLAITATFAVDHLELTGLRQAGWATPHMGASHLLFALASTAYIAVGIKFEEGDLRRSFGTSYDAYAARVPALLPRIPRKRGPVAPPIS